MLARVGLYPSGGHLVKRVIGVGGDTIRCCDQQGRILVNGTPLNEDDYIAPQRECNGPMTHTCAWTAGPVPAGHILLMGDNRDDSLDSTAHLCTRAKPHCVPGDEYVDTDLVVGKVFVLFWQRDRFTILHRPATFATVEDPS
jgi:signal peptidase I